MENKTLNEYKKEKVVESQSENTLDLSGLSEVDQKRVLEIANEINFTNSQYVVQYGVGVQSKISNFADNILNEIRTKDSGYVGDLLTGLMFKVKELDIESVGPNKSIFVKLPIIGQIVDSSKKFMAKYKKLSSEIETIIDELDKSRTELLKDIIMFDKLYDKNLEYFKELDLYIAAGSMKLKELQESIIPEIKQKVETSGDPSAAQKVNDLIQLANRFEKKIHDLRLSKMISLQTAPQIRLVQNNDQLLVDKIQSSILNTIPLWKNQIIIAIGLFRQEKALKMQKSVSDTTNELLLKNSEMLKTNSLNIARESEKGIVEIETLKKVNNDLINTIEETLKIQEDGRLKRKQVEQELATIENQLREKLMAMKS